MKSVRLFSSNDELAALLSARANEAARRVRMPLVESYESHIDSDIADMKNIGKAPWRDRLPPRSCCALHGRTILGASGHCGTGEVREARGYLTKGAPLFPLVRW